MVGHKKLHLLHLIFVLHSLSAVSLAHRTPASLFRKVGTQIPSSMHDSSNKDSPLLNRMIVYKSRRPYLRTSLGLFPISSINFTTKLITISHSFCSSSTHLLPPSLLSAGFPTPQPNSLLLFNCSHQTYPDLANIRNCSNMMHHCGSLNSTSCLLVDDPGELYSSFDPRVLNCSHYSRVYKTSMNDSDKEDTKLGTRVFLEISGHVPNICGECQKPDGNCGAALRCLCHAKECKDKVFSMAGSLNPSGSALLSLLSFFMLQINRF